MSEMKYTLDSALENNNVLVTPDGKSVTIIDLLNLCYSMNEVSLQVFLSVLKNRKTEEDLTFELKLSKATINRALSLLMRNGLIKRTKEAGNRAGRPRYIYYVDNDNITKITNDLTSCTPGIQKIIESFVNSIKKLLENQDTNQGTS